MLWAELLCYANSLALATDSSADVFCISCKVFMLAPQAAVANSLKQNSIHLSAAISEGT